jgi:hypothetical protein
VIIVIIIIISIMIITIMDVCIIIIISSTISIIYREGDPLTMGYLDNLDNGSPNKYEKKS